ncbi:MAG: hypothetical protein PHF56_17350 [Desulfuromonadaceae bacterium]|nr:hypothetical protein [Desulfuromonadaceae bacterium]
MPIKSQQKKEVNKIMSHHDIFVFMNYPALTQNGNEEGKRKAGMAK